MSPRMPQSPGLNQPRVKMTYISRMNAPRMGSPRVQMCPQSIIIPNSITLNTPAQQQNDQASVAVPTTTTASGSTTANVPVSSATGSLPPKKEVMYFFLFDIYFLS